MTNNKQQTAVEWYAHRLYEIEIAYNQGVIDTEVYAKSKIHALEQAKEMEWDQINDAYLQGFEDNDCNTIEDTFNLYYYNETYGGNK
jgi:hypothetical protein